MHVSIQIFIVSYKHQLIPNKIFPFPAKDSSITAIVSQITLASILNGEFFIEYGSAELWVSIDIDPSIDQPTVPVIMFCWVVGQKCGNTVFRCKLCLHQFTGSPILAMTHFDLRMSNQHLKQCKAPLRPALLKEQIKSILDEKKASEVVISKKRGKEVAAAENM